MRRRQGALAGMAMVITLLLCGAVAGVARIPDPVTLSAETSSSTSTTAGVQVGDVVDTTVATTAPDPGGPADADADGAAEATTSTRRPAGPTTSPRPPGSSPATTLLGNPVGGNHRDRPLGPDEVGSVDDLGPGPIERTVPQPCTPSSQPTPTHAIAVVELRMGCVRALVPAGTQVGTEVGWSPDGTWLMATVASRVTRIARDGSWRQDLGGGGQARRVVLSPDGTRMAVVGHVAHGTRSQSHAVIVAAADGTNPQVIDERAVKAPSWSPDSQLLGLVTNDGGSLVPDVLHLVGRDGRERASRTFTGRAFGGVAGTPFAPMAAPLGRPVFLPDGRIFQPAFVELPRMARGLWLNPALEEIGGPLPPNDVMWNDSLSVPADSSFIAYTAHPGHGPAGNLVRVFDLRTGATVTVGEGDEPASSHRSRAIAFVQREPSGGPRGVAVTDAGGAVHPVWRHGGTNCTCVSSGLPAWTTDDGAIGVVSAGG